MRVVKRSRLLTLCSLFLLGSSLTVRLGASAALAAKPIALVGVVPLNACCAGTVAWSPDGRHIAVGNTAALQIMATGNGAGRTRAFVTVARVIGPVSSLAWSPNSRLIAIGSPAGPVTIVTLAGRFVKLLQGHRSSVTSLDWLREPAGVLLASASSDGTVRVWQDNYELLTKLTVQAGAVSHVAWAPQQNVLAVATKKGLNLSKISGRIAARLTGIGPNPLADFSPDGSVLATGSQDGGIRLWSPHGVFMASFGFGIPVTSMSWSPDNRRLAVATSDRTVRIWNVETVTSIISSEPALHVAGGRSVQQNIAWSPSGRSIALTNRDSSLRIWWL